MLLSFYTNVNAQAAAFILGYGPNVAYHTDTTFVTSGLYRQRKLKVLTISLYV